MADKFMQTTSSKTLDEFNETKTSAIAPKIVEAQKMSALAMDLSESYQLVKKHQQKYNELSLRQNQNESFKRIKLLSTDTDATDATDAANKENAVQCPKQGEWQEVCYAKNKLKRKKKMSTSLTSVTDSVNQEKRTRIEGIQLNCRGKLQIKESQPGLAATNSTAAAIPKSMSQTHDKILTKPPLPPTMAKATTAGATGNTANTVTPPPRLKRKLQENVQTIQKLNALAEQLRIEINELKTSLTSERSAVRVLRAQNECEARKWKNEVKKLQHTVEVLKKSNPTLTKRMSDSLNSTSNDSTHLTAAAGSLVNYEIQRLTNEITMLKEANKTLEDKKLINCDADRRKAADIRTLRDSYEIRLTQLTKSAKIEISRLLEEIKTKERNIGQLKKDFQILQKQTASTKNSQQNADLNKIKTSKTTQEKTTNKLTTTKSTTKKPKKLQNTNNLNNNDNHKKTNKNVETVEAKPKDTNLAQHTNEITQLKDIELIKNSKNLHNNVNSKSNKSTNTNTITTTTSSNTIKTKILTQSQNNILQTLETNENQKSLLNNDHLNGLLTTTTTTTPKTATTTNDAKCIEYQREYQSMPPHELTERLLNNKTTATTTTERECNDLPIYRTKDNNSDSDSALSSAPPSISPQPPPAGMDTNDIWQTIRTYTQDIEKLQKEIELLQKENEKLHTELHLAKQQILESEKTAIEANKQNKIPQFLERIKYLEDQEHQLQAECDELREQNELLEFRILELEETNDKWSLQSHVTTPSHTTTTITANTSSTSTTHANTALQTKDVWSNNKAQNEAMQLIFSNINKNNYGHIDSGITSPQSQHNIEDDINLMDASNDELCRRIGNILKKTTPLDDEDKQYLQHVLTLVQQLDLFSQRTSGPASLNTSCSSDEPSSLELAKSRISDYSSASSTSSARTSCENACHIKSLKHINAAPASGTVTNSRIVATVQPYSSTNNNNNNNQSITSQPHPPTNTPTDSPRKTRAAWQCNSLSESGVFVEDNDFIEHSTTIANHNNNNNSSFSDQSVCTQTDFNELDDYNNIGAFRVQQKLQRYHSSPLARPATNQQHCTHHTNEQKRLQYYKERLELLESKVLIYESSGDIQAKRLADRLQREIQLEKEVKELQDRVELLEQENLTLEEEKCEFEEAENDTRLRLQRLEVELEILTQRNVELEMSKEALSAKYKDCRSECLILRDDLAACETQVRLIEEDKQIAKDNLEFLHSILPLFCLYSTVLIGKSQQQPPQVTAMGNIAATANSLMNMDTKMQPSVPIKPIGVEKMIYNCNHEQGPQELNYLKEEVKCLRHQIKELHSRHYAALESADSHWVDLEREYKDREEMYRSKEQCLKQKINKLQDCLRDDARAANEKIQQLEESEAGLKLCLVRISKEHRDIQEQYKCICEEFERYKDENKHYVEQQRPMSDAYETEKKRNKSLTDELAFMHRLQQESELRNKVEEDSLRTSLYDLKKQFLHAEVTNSELKEEVITLEHQIEALQKRVAEYEDKIRVLIDEIRTKEEMCDKLERQAIEKTDRTSAGFSLAQELKDDIPYKRQKCKEVIDLKTAAEGLDCALKNFEGTNDVKNHKQFHNIAMDVKLIADNLLSEQEQPTEVSTAANNNSSAKSIPGAVTSSQVNNPSEEEENENMNVTIDSKGRNSETDPNGNDTNLNPNQDEPKPRKTPYPIATQQGQRQQEEIEDRSLSEESSFEEQSRGVQTSTDYLKKQPPFQPTSSKTQDSDQTPIKTEGTKCCERTGCSHDISRKNKGDDPNCECEDPTEFATSVELFDKDTQTFKTNSSKPDQKPYLTEEKVVSKPIKTEGASCCNKCDCSYGFARKNKGDDPNCGCELKPNSSKFDQKPGLSEEKLVHKTELFDKASQTFKTISSPFGIEEEKYPSNIECDWPPSQAEDALFLHDESNQPPAISGYMDPNVPTVTGAHLRGSFICACPQIMDDPIGTSHIKCCHYPSTVAHGMSQQQLNTQQPNSHGVCQCLQPNADMYHQRQLQNQAPWQSQQELHSQFPQQPQYSEQQQQQFPQYFGNQQSNIYDDEEYFSIHSASSDSEIFRMLKTNARTPEQPRTFNQTPTTPQITKCRQIQSAQHSQSSKMGVAEQKEEQQNTCQTLCNALEQCNDGVLQLIIQLVSKLTSCDKKALIHEKVNKIGDVNQSACTEETQPASTQQTLIKKLSTCLSLCQNETTNEASQENMPLRSSFQTFSNTQNKERTENTKNTANENNCKTDCKAKCSLREVVHRAMSSLTKNRLSNIPIDNNLKRDDNDCKNVAGANLKNNADDDFNCSKIGLCNSNCRSRCAGETVTQRSINSSVIIDKKSYMSPDSDNPLNDAKVIDSHSFITMDNCSCTSALNRKQTCSCRQSSNQKSNGSCLPNCTASCNQKSALQFNPNSKEELQLTFQQKQTQRRVPRETDNTEGSRRSSKSLPKEEFKGTCLPNCSANCNQKSALQFNSKSKEALEETCLPNCTASCNQKSAFQFNSRSKEELQETCLPNCTASCNQKSANQFNQKSKEEFEKSSQDRNNLESRPSSSSQQDPTQSRMSDDTGNNVESRPSSSSQKDPTQSRMSDVTGNNVESRPSSSSQQDPTQSRMSDVTGNNVESRPRSSSQQDPTQSRVLDDTVDKVESLRSSKNVLEELEDTSQQNPSSQNVSDGELEETTQQHPTQKHMSKTMDLIGCLKTPNSNITKNNCSPDCTNLCAFNPDERTEQDMELVPYDNAISAGSQSFKTAPGISKSRVSNNPMSIAEPCAKLLEQFANCLNQAALLMNEASKNQSATNNNNDNNLSTIPTSIELSDLTPQTADETGETQSRISTQDRKRTSAVRPAAGDSRTTGSVCMVPADDGGPDVIGPCGSHCDCDKDNNNIINNNSSNNNNSNNNNSNNTSSYNNNSNNNDNNGDLGPCGYDCTCPDLEEAPCVCDSSSASGSSSSGSSCSSSSSSDECCNCCHCRALRRCQKLALKKKSAGGDSVDNNNKQMKMFIDSLLIDMEAMESVRRCSNTRPVTSTPPKNRILSTDSYPVRITEARELGLTSLFVKWIIQDCYNIAGYEIYVDGCMTNRYFSAKHEAAVVCDIDPCLPHKIVLIAQPKSENKLALLSADSCQSTQQAKQNDAWTPSVFFYTGSAPKSKSKSIC